MTSFSQHSRYSTRDRNLIPTQFSPEWLLLLSRSRLCHYSVGVPGGTLVSMNRFSTLCGWLVQQQEWRMKGEYDRVSKRDRLRITPNLTTRWATGNDNFVCSSLWDFKSSFTCRKISRHGTFPLYFPSEGKVCCGFISSLKLHRLCRILNPQPLSPMASTLTASTLTAIPPRRPQSDYNWAKSVRWFPLTLTLLLTQGTDVRLGTNCASLRI
jgi:hypothetical protein